MKLRTYVIAVASLAVIGLMTMVTRRDRSARKAAKILLDGAQRAQLLAAAEAAFAATLRAFESNDDARDASERDSVAAEAATILTELVETLRPSLGSLEDSCALLVHRVSEAQLQLMAFAINRKNRGTPGKAEIERENGERRAFKRDVGAVYHELSAALS